MKFGKNLQRIVEISDPAYCPFFVNYRMLKKLIKELPNSIPAEDGTTKASPECAKVQASSQSPPFEKRCDPTVSLESVGQVQTIIPQQQERGDNTEETKTLRSFAGSGAGINSTGELAEQKKEELGKSPGEIAFFKLLHTEFRKATFFFGKAQQEFEIREERARDGFEIIKKQPNSFLVNEQWSMMAKSIFRLYRDLLLLETYAIMSYCSFSKILKKHDKVTGHETRGPFMTNVVNKANFTHYPKLLDMINRCQILYDEVSQLLLKEGKEGLYEDERLFINMINRLNDQVLETSEGEGGQSRKEVKRPATKLPAQQQWEAESVAISTLRTLVEANDANAFAAQVSDGAGGVDCDDRKRSAQGLDSSTKRVRLESE